MKSFWAALCLFWVLPASACDLVRDLRPGAGRGEILRMLGDRRPVREITRCGGTEITLPGGQLCRETPGVRDARLVLRFSANQLQGWELVRRGERMELLAFAEKQWGVAGNKPPLDTSRPWANLHWQGSGWQASYVGQGEGGEVMESLASWGTARPTPTTAPQAPDCARD